jgi:DNA invertase Pin-like site-specific DNA recombinase
MRVATVTAIPDKERTMATACYARISTAGQNLDGQIAELERWLAGHGITDVVWFIDKATGDNLRRPEFEKLQAAVFAGEITCIIVYKLDRISRSLADGINTLVNWIKAGIRVVSTSQQLDFAGATGQLVAAVLFAVAQMEQETRRERQRAGIEAVKADPTKAAAKYAGRKPGALKRGVKPARAVQLRDKGLTYGEIATAMGISESSVRRYLGKV